jgi:hypothetical protein
MHSNEARFIAQSLVIGKYNGSVDELPNFPGLDTNIVQPYKVPEYTDQADTTISVDFSDFDYRNGVISVQPSNGWDDSSSRKKHREQQSLFHFADLYKIDRLDDITVITPFHDNDTTQFY